MKYFFFLICIQRKYRITWKPLGGRMFQGYMHSLRNPIIVMIQPSTDKKDDNKEGNGDKGTVLELKRQGLQEIPWSKLIVSRKFFQNR